MKGLEKEKQNNPKMSRKTETTKITEEVNQRPDEQYKINTLKNRLFEKISKIHYSLVQLIKKGGRRYNSIASEMKKKYKQWLPQTYVEQLGAFGTDYKPTNQKS